MNIEDLRKNNLIVFECISGSRAQGLDTKDSDTDIKGVFIMPEEMFYGFDYIPQVTNETNDIVFYEVKRFFELLLKNNPNILEMLNVADEHVIYRHRIFGKIEPALFLSKQCRESFAHYAMSQLKRARGLKKKILNPVDEEKKTILDFCYVVEGQGSKPVLQWLADNRYSPEMCGLSSIPHMANVYALFYDKTGSLGFQGLVRKSESDQVVLSSIPKGQTAAATLYCNLDGYSAYCKDFKEYREWVKNRNETRYKNTIEHGNNYDAKNMMHTFRLLAMAEEILRDGKIIVKRPDRDWLLKIKSGSYTYDYLVEEAEKKMEIINDLYEKSTLPECVDKDAARSLLIKIRQEFYESRH